MFFQFSHFNIFSFSILNHDPKSELEAHLDPYGSELQTGTVRDQLVSVMDLGVGRELKQTANIGLKFNRWTQTHVNDAAASYLLVLYINMQKFPSRLTIST